MGRNFVALDTFRRTAAVALLWSSPSIDSYDTNKARIREVNQEKSKSLRDSNSTVRRDVHSLFGGNYTLAASGLLGNPPPSPEKKIQEQGKVYDFVIVGHGSAGRSALLTLQELCPRATIAIVDPHRSPNTTSSSIHTSTDAIPAWATALDPQSRRLRLQCSRTSNAPAATEIHYRHSILVATGSRGAPPPHYLIDDEARDRVVELRPTLLPNPLQRRSIQSTEDVRKKVLSEATQGRHVVVLGSGWEAIDLAVCIASRSSPKVGQGSGSLVFGSAAPLGHVLPRYLGTAVSKRLRSRKLVVQDRTLVRYISQAKSSRNSNPLPAKGLVPLQLFTANSTDLLDTNSFNADWIVVAPDIGGSRGSAVLPTDTVPTALQESRGGRSWYQPWSLLAATDKSMPSKLACYRDDGRVVVNTEFLACDGVYATGSAAKFPNVQSGHASVASVGVEDGAVAGQMAAWNMSRHYRQQTTRVIASTMVKDPIPVFRSDKLQYETSNVTSLSNVGIIALCVGDCDAEQLQTHGVWWTNLAAQRRLRSLGASDSGTTRMRRKQSKAEKNGLIYGLGVVYYIDRLGRIRGVMTWGLPFTSGASNDLNQELVSNVKALIGSNVASATGMDRTRMTDHLTEESRRFVKLAFAGWLEDQEFEDPATKQALQREMNSLLRPLHRFTEPRPPDARRLGLLKRKDGVSQVSPGDNLFATDSLNVEDVPPLPKMDLAAGRDKSMSEWKHWEQVEAQWDLNEEIARPLKEDLLWLRKGDEMRSISSRENLRTAYNKAIWST